MSYRGYAQKLVLGLEAGINTYLSERLEGLRQHSGLSGKGCNMRNAEK
jgi:hypothetical protein